MRQSLSFITIGVQDLENAKRFYTEKFGWKAIKDSDGIVFFRLNGFILGLFPEDELAKDAGVNNNGKGFKKFARALNLNSESEVDNVFNELRLKNVNIIKDPEKVYWGGYRGYITDNEQNLWEIAYNPFLEMDKDGNVLGHQ
jgi:uncharacterized protein